MGISVEGADQYVHNVTKRMPFRFGNVTVTEGPHLFLRLDVDVGGPRQTGLSMGGLGPMWYYKDPHMTMDEGVGSMLEVCESAWTLAGEIEGNDTVFGFWRELYRRQMEWGTETDHPSLLLSFGVSLVEQAVIDAFCRATGTTFAEAVRENTLGIDPGAVYDELEGAEPADLLPAEPNRSAAVRHTVGFADPLEREDLAPDERLDDGLPQTLAKYVETDGVDHFKIKLIGDGERDRERLRAIASVVEASSLDEYAFTIDANEQYESVAAFREQWEGHEADPDLAPFLGNLLYVEQPLARDDAFGSPTREVLADWEDRPPVIIDESDDRVDRLGRALATGYDGTSHKNIKGVFKGVVNRCLIEHRRRTDGGDYVMSCEDMTNIGPVALQQDLAVVGTLGADHVERNGHHYNRGLSMFPEPVREAVLDAHPDLYRRHEDGFPTLDVEDGRIEFGSAVDAPFGHALELDLSDVTPLEEWEVESIYE